MQNKRKSGKMLRFAKKFIRSLFPCTYEESSSNSQCTGTRNGLSCCILQCRKTSNSAKYSQQFTYIVHYPLPNTNIITEEFSPFHLSTQSYFPPNASCAATLQKSGMPAMVAYSLSIPFAIIISSAFSRKRKLHFNNK